MANEVGLNRSYISQFESGKMLLEDAQLSLLRDFFEESGFGFPELEIQPLHTSPEPNCFWERDGIVINCTVSEESAETLLEEYELLRHRIEQQGTVKVRTLLFGGVSRESENNAQRLIVLMARCFQIVEALQGRSTAKSTLAKDEASTTKQLTITTINQLIDAQRTASEITPTHT